MKMKALDRIKWRAARALPALAILYYGCRPAFRPTLFSALSASKTGIDFVNSLPEQTADGMNIIQYLYYYNGGGVAAGDLNNDGLPDLYFTSNTGQNKLYLNRGDFHFEDATEKAGVAGSGSWKTGVAMADVNADGWLDIYVCQVGDYKSFKGRNQLFINNGDGTFSEKAAEYGLDLSAFCTQAAFFDYDLDGDLDCFVLCHSVHSPESYKDTSISRQFDPLASDRLFRNDGGKFVDITPSSGLHDGKSGYGLGLAVGDVNGDGYPDIYVANDFHENDFLYYNVQGKYFREGIIESTGHTSNFSMGCDMADVNNDCRPDIVTLDMKPEDETTLKASQPADQYQVYEYKHSYGYHRQFPRNCLQLNRGTMDGRRWTADDHSSVTSPPDMQRPKQNNPPPSTLRPPPPAVFSEIGQLAGIAATDWSWSPLLADFDLDGWKDLFVSNGIPHRPNDNDYLKYISSGEVQRNATDLELIARMPSGAVANYCFRNKDNLTFEDVSNNWGLDHKGFSNGAIYADLDNDGDPDLVTNNLNEPASVFRNNASGSHYIKIKFSGEGGNTFGIGAQVKVFAGNRTQYFENQPVRGFQSSVEPGVLIAGLGNDEKADSLLVIWPGGARETQYSIAANRTLTLERKNARPGPAGDSGPPSRLRLAGFETQIPFAQPPGDLQDIAREKLMPWSLGTQGPDIVASDLNGDGLDDFYTLDTAFIQQAGGAFLPEPTPLFFKNYLPKNTSCVRVADFDGDGSEDMFIGTRSVTGAYGLSAKSYLLKNNGANQFTETGIRAGKGEAGIGGMVADACWADVDNDRRPDLVVCGEWMPVTVFRNTPGGFEKTEIPHSAGLWNCLRAADFDGDGDMDLVAGNLGLNSNLRASAAEPLGLWVKDFDGNGSTEPVLTYYRHGKNCVFADKDALVNQLPFLKKRFLEYRKYAESAFEEVFPEDLRKGALHREAELLASCYFENAGNGQWKIHPLPNEAQFGPVFALLPFDFNGDGREDLLLGGNFYEVQPAVGRFDASFGTLLLGDGKGNFRPAEPSESGIWLPGPVRGLHMVNGPGGRKRLLVTSNSGPFRLIDLAKFSAIQ